MKYRLLDLYDVKSGMGNKSREDFHESKFDYKIIMFKEIFYNSRLPEILDLSTTVRLKQGELERFDVKEGDVFLTSSSETMNELAMSSVAYCDYPNTVYSGFSKRLRPKTDKTNYEYMRYWFRSKVFRNEIYKTVSMTTRANLNLNILSGIEITLPDLNKQESISKILSSLDDKIEINNRINSNLEELAQILYKRWFVDFEFPSEEGKPYKSSGGEMVESELGLIPKGWEVESLSDNQYCSLIKPGIEPFDDKKTYIATADVSNTKITNLETKITMNDRPSRANMQPQSNSVWFAKMKDSRKLMRFGETSSRIEDLILSTGFAGVLCTAALNYFWTYLQTAEFDTAKNNLANGTTMEAINNSGISLIKLVIPDSQTLLAFNQILNPMYEMIEKNEIQNLNLANTRDLLLPKLMSGEIEV